MAIQWSSWASLGKPPETELGRPFAQRNQDGRLEVFALGQGGIFNISQVVPKRRLERWLAQQGQTLIRRRHQIARCRQEC